MPELLNRREEDLKDISRHELKEVLGIDAEPKFSHVYRWRYGLPQYEKGHLERTAQIESQLGEMDGLHLIGNSLHGIGVPDCIRTAKEAVQRLTASDMSESTSAR